MVLRISFLDIENSFCKLASLLICSLFQLLQLKFQSKQNRGTQRQFSEKYLFGRRFEIQNFRNICCKISCLPACLSQGFRTSKKWYNCLFLTDFYPKKGHLEFSRAFFRAEIFEKLSFDPYNFRITRLSARKSEQMKSFQGIKICLYLPFKY